MKSFLLKRTGLFLALLAASLLLLAVAFTGKYNQKTMPRGPAAPVAEIDFEVIKQNAEEQAILRKQERLSPAQYQQMAQKLLAGTLTHRELHNQVREGTLTDADFAAILQRAILNNVQGNTSQLGNSYFRDRNLLEGEPAYLTGTWVTISSLKSFLCVYTFRPDGTYEYVVGGKLLQDKTLREWMRHRGTYRINKVTEREAAFLNEYLSPIESYLYTVTLTPQKSTIQLTQDPTGKGRLMQMLASYGLLNNQAESFGYRAGSQLTPSSMELKKLRAGNTKVFSFRVLDWKPIKLADLPRK